MKLNFEIAGISILFEMPRECRPGDLGMLGHFRTDGEKTPDHRFSVELVDAVDAPLGELKRQEPHLLVYGAGQTQCCYTVNGQDHWSFSYLRVLHEGTTHTVQLQKEYAAWMGETLILMAMGLDRLLAGHQGIVLHASYVAWKGRALLFTAPSGTGKSTQADLWVKHRGAELINGDRACIRVMKDGIYACGIPPCGSSRVSKNVCLPLGAVIYLKQAPCTAIAGLEGFRAFRHIFEGCAMDTADRENLACVSDVVQKIAEQVPVWLLSCTPDESAVRAVEEMLKV